MNTELLVGTITGLVIHQFNPMIESWEARPNMPPAWTRIFRYGVGGVAHVVISKRVFSYLYRPGMDRKETADLQQAASVLSFVSIMVGVVVGYLLDGLLERLK